MDNYSNILVQIRSFLGSLLITSGAGKSLQVCCPQTPEKLPEGGTACFIEIADQDGSPAPYELENIILLQLPHFFKETSRIGNFIQKVEAVPLGIALDPLVPVSEEEPRAGAVKRSTAQLG